jgi:hypothetical protein
MQEYDWFWLSIGFIGQALFSMRFLVQWLQSERVKRRDPQAFARRGRRPPRMRFTVSTRCIVGGRPAVIYFRNLTSLKERSATATRTTACLAGS